MQDKWSLFQKFMITESAQISLNDFLINSLLIVVLSIILEYTYSKCANSLSNRKMFAYNFLMISFTTMLIISIVKSSLALSLGLVGALSIVRFRAAIKEPEELAYLFFAISIGLGLGANQRFIVVAAFVVMMIILWVRYLLRGKNTKQNLFLNISSDVPVDIQLNDITAIIKKYFKAAELKRFDENKNLIEASFLVDIDKTEKLQSCKQELQKLNDSVSVSFIDNKTY